MENRSAALCLPEVKVMCWIKQSKNVSGKVRQKLGVSVEKLTRDEVKWCLWAGAAKTMTCPVCVLAGGGL